MTLCRKRRHKRELKKMDTFWTVAERMLDGMKRRGFRATGSQADSFRKAAKKAGMSPSMIESRLHGITIGETRRERLRRESDARFGFSRMAAA